MCLPIRVFDGCSAASRISSRNSLWRTGSTTQFEGAINYTYDNTDQLKGEDRQWSGSVDAAYTYDINGNRTQYANVSFVRNYTNSDNNQITSDGWFTYTHDDEGNLTSKGNSNNKYEYEWDWRNRLTAVKLFVNWGSGLSLYWTMDYAYDAFNQLVRRGIDNDGPGGYGPVNGFYSHEDGQIVLEFGQYAWGSLTQRYVWGPTTDQLLITEFNSALYGTGNVFYALGDIVGTNHDSTKFSTGTGTSVVIVHRYIDAFGNGGSWSNFDGQSYDGGPFIYTGRFLDNMTGLQWNLHRWYDSSTGRWMSEDPIGFGGDPTNLYRYVENAPTMYTDPTGLEIAGPGYDPYNWKSSHKPGDPDDPWYFFLPWSMSPRRDTEDYCFAAGKSVGWILFGVGTGGLIFGPTSGTYGINLLKLQPTAKVASHVGTRPYINSPHTIRNIIQSGRPVADPGGVPGALRWDAPGCFNGSKGIFELVIDPKTNRIPHFLFKSTGG